MTAIQSNNQQIKFVDFPQIQVDDINERCGEVYITLNGTLVFHCSHCASNYGSIDNFLDHLSTEHYKDVQGKEENEHDVETGRSDVEDYSTGDQIHEQKLVSDVEDDNIDVVNDDFFVEYIDYVNDEDIDNDNVDGANDYDIDKFKEILQSNESKSLDVTNTEHNVAKSRGETDIKGHSLGIKNLEEKDSKTESKRYKRKFKDCKCKQCGKAFRTNEALKVHISTHSDERNYQCTICGFAFKDRANCDAHVRRLHLASNKIECGYCPKTFFTQTEVKNHRRTHTGERPHVCNICGKSYIARNHLNTHMKYHTSEPAFKCTYCEKAFYEKPRYKDHLLVHTKEKRFVCEICAASFPRFKSWMRHAKSHENSKN